MCRDYITVCETPDFTVSASKAEIMAEDEGGSLSAGYLESLAIYRKIAEKIPEYSGFLMHGVAAQAGCHGVAFLAKSGVGKSTHASYWQELLGDRFCIINGDKPLIRYVDGKPYAYGTPWAGKENIQLNTRAPLDKICFIERGEQNECTQLGKNKILSRLQPQIYFPKDTAKVLKIFDILDCVVENCDFYLIKCRNDLSAAKSAYEGLGI